MSKNKNIMILFLSDVKIYDEKKVKLYPYRYTEKDNIIDVNGIQTNEAAVKTVLQKLHNNKETLSEIYMLCTNKVRSNISDNVHFKHIDFFKCRIHNFCKYEAGITEPEDYHEITYNETSIGDEVFDPIIEMANKIKNTPEFYYTVYVDMTGGMRNSSMLMLSIMRLLQYKGIKVKQVLYSNFAKETDIDDGNIENYMTINNHLQKTNEDKINQEEDNASINFIDDVTDIYELNNLIAGAEEFVNFGSAKILQRYFNKNNKACSKHLKDLIRTMNRFSENIRLCRTSKFEQSIKTLYFSLIIGSNNNNILSLIFSLQLFASKKSIFFFKFLFNDDAKPVNMQHLEIIKWCLDMDFLQQALTMYVEWIPDYIVDNNILYCVDDTLKNKIELLSKEKGENVNYIFINAKYLLNNEAVIIFHTNNLKLGNAKSCLKTNDDVLNIICTYRKIKDIRNNTNHANTYNKLDSYKDIKELIDNAISDLDKATK